MTEHLQTSSNWWARHTPTLEQIAYSPEHDSLLSCKQVEGNAPSVGETCAVVRNITFYEAVGEAQPAFARYRLSWTDALGCRHLVRYDLDLQCGEVEPRASAA